MYTLHSLQIKAVLLFPFQHMCTLFLFFCLIFFLMRRKVFSLSPLTRLVAVGVFIDALYQTEDIGILSFLFLTLLFFYQLRYEFINFIKLFKRLLFHFICFLYCVLISISLCSSIFLPLLLLSRDLIFLLFLAP